MYGDSGEKPLINGNGNVESTVRLFDASYITVRNLELTNYTETPSTDFRSGIRLVARDTVMKGIIIQNCYIHHINFNHAIIHRKNCNIMFVCLIISYSPI